MEGHVVIVNGKPCKVTERKGRLYKRVVVEVEIEQYKHATQKAQTLGGKNCTDLINELIQGFNNSMGFGKTDTCIKEAGSLFDRRMSRHIQTAVIRALEEIAQCPVDASLN